LLQKKSGVVAGAVFAVFGRFLRGVLEKAVCRRGVFVVKLWWFAW
jgi:hypothetical protein